MKNKKFKILISLLVLIPTVVWATNFTEASKDIQTRTETIKPILLTNKDNIISLRGTVESVTSKNVYGQLPNRIDNVLVEVGDEVTAGQVLAIIDTRDIELSIAQQRASLFQMRAAIRDIELSLENLQTEHNNLTVLYNVGAASREDINQSQIAITNLQNRYNDATIAYQNVVISNQRILNQLNLSLEQAYVEYNLAKNALDTMKILDEQEMIHIRQRISGLHAGVEMAELGLDFTSMEIGIKILEKQLVDAQVRSPINGVITDVIAKEGGNGAGLLFVVQDLDNLEIKTRVREYDIKDMYVGMEVGIRSYTTDNVYIGKIKNIYPTAISDIPVKFNMVVEVTDVNTKLLVGSSAWVDITLDL